MSNFQINLEVTVDRFQINKKKVCQIVEKILSNEKINEAQVNVILIDDKQIIELNEKYLNKNNTTDVISFVLEKDVHEKKLEGEVYANFEQIERQAFEYQTTTMEEFFRIVIHGVLHLVGYDDQSVAGKKQMTEKEDFYLALI